MDTLPSLRTGRLLLRAFSASDSQAVLDMFSDDRVTEFYDLETFTHADQASALLAQRMQQDLRHAARWAICRQEDAGTVIGSCGYHAAQADSCSLEIGYDLHAAYWGCGYAHEAVSAMLEHCFSNDLPFRVNRISATTDLGSERSMRLLQRLGFVQEGILRQYGFWKGRFHDVRLFSLLRQEWRNACQSPAEDHPLDGDQ